jgi:ATP-binding cassette subfamily F protein uup
MSAAQLLNLFLFPPETQYNYIERLSGGEQRRLYLCTVLMQNPNFLILDEPTNDLDIITLNILEDYLKSFDGCVVIVSHDRFFTDKIVDHLFVFEGNGKVTDFPGNYTIYRNNVLAEQEQEKIQNKVQSTVQNGNLTKETKKDQNITGVKRKLTFNEKREFELLESEIENLENNRSELEKILNSGTLAHDELFQKSEELVKIKQQLDKKELRWLELSELN